MGKKQRLLVINDEPAMLSQIARWLCSDGYNVDTTLTGAEAEQMVTRHKYDLVIIDFHLKKEPQGEKCASDFILGLQRMNSLPILVTSATLQHLDASHLGVDDALVMDGLFWLKLSTLVEKLLSANSEYID
jgi:DNA-binding response OmpR family regulator